MGCNNFKEGDIVIHLKSNKEYYIDKVEKYTMSILADQRLRVMLAVAPNIWTITYHNTIVSI